MKKKMLGIVLSVALILSQITSLVTVKADSSIQINSIFFSSEGIKYYNIPTIQGNCVMEINFSQPVEAVVYAAFYNQAGQMVSVYIDNTSMQNSIFSFNISITPDMNDFKIFILDNNLAPRLLYPQTRRISFYGINVFAPYVSECIFMDSNYNRYNIKWLPNTEIYIDGILQQSVTPDRFKTAYRIDFLSENKLNKFNRIDIKTYQNYLEYAYVTSMTSDGQGKVWITLFDGNEKILKCVDMPILNGMYSSDFLSQSSSIQNKLVKYAMNQEGEIDCIEVTNPNRYLILSYVKNNYRYNESNNSFGSFSINADTKIFLIQESSVAMGTVAYFTNNNLYNLEAYNVSETGIAGAIVVSVFPISN